MRSVRPPVETPAGFSPMGLRLARIAHSGPARAGGYVRPSGCGVALGGLQSLGQRVQQRRALGHQPQEVYVHADR